MLAVGPLGPQYSWFFFLAWARQSCPQIFVNSNNLVSMLSQKISHHFMEVDTGEKARTTNQSSMTSNWEIKCQTFNIISQAFLYFQHYSTKKSYPCFMFHFNFMAEIFTLFGWTLAKSWSNIFDKWICYGN